jgi:CubicO group peptidase (beta-lactamase class C family)
MSEEGLRLHNGCGSHYVKLLLGWVTLLLYVVPASAASWTDSDYLYRYFTWGARRLVSPRSDDYKSYGYHVIENGAAAFQFTAGNRDLVPSTVEYHDGENLKQVDLNALLRSTGTHAFVVVRDNEVLYEDYFNGFARDSLCTTWSVSKSVTSALVGIAIADGYIKSIDDPIVNYLPELKGQGFDLITIKNLLTMGSGIRYRFGFFPWDEFVLVGYYPNLTQWLLSSLRIVEPPGQSFHYNNFNPELIGLILQRTTHRPPSKYLEEKIWKPIGMEYPATWSIDGKRDGFRNYANDAQCACDRYGQVRPALSQQRQLGRQADRAVELGRRVHRERSERQSSVGDLRAMAERWRLLQIFLVGRFGSRERLQLHGSRHLRAVHFCLTADESSNRPHRRCRRNRSTLLARNLPIHRGSNRQELEPARVVAFAALE